MKVRGSFLTDDELVATVLRVVATDYCVPPEKVTVATVFTADLGGDSLDQVELVMAIEDAFGIDIPDEEAQNFTSVAAVLEYLRGLP